MVALWFSDRVPRVSVTVMWWRVEYLQVALLRVGGIGWLVGWLVRRRASAAGTRMLVGRGTTDPFSSFGSLHSSTDGRVGVARACTCRHL